MTGARVQRTLAKAIIPNKGANKLSITGRGNDFVRENGTAVRIYNLAAFATHEDAKYAAEEWKLGLALEKAADLDGAQEHYKAALNSTMSFSVLAENASDFNSAYEINCVVEDVPASEAMQNRGIKTVLGIQNPRPITVVTNGTSAASMFTDDVPAATVPAKATTTPTRRRGATAGAK